MTEFGTLDMTPRNTGLTNGREVAAYAIAQVVKIVVVYAISYSGLMSPVYVTAGRIGGQLGVLFAGSIFSTFWGAAAFPLFLLLRAGFGGVPTLIGERRGAFTTSGGEIGAFAVAFA